MDRNQIVQPENIVCKKPTLMNDNNMHYCPGCSHGVVHKLIAEVIEEMGMEDKAVGVSFTYQGDGDLACIGTCETIHALNRGENIVIVFVNNAIYGMTGGQMAPTTLIGQKTSTCPYGRDPEIHGYPLKIADIAAQLEGTCYVTRQSVESVGSILKAKKALRKAFEASMAGKGSSLVEFVSTCNSGWKLTPAKANEWMKENMFPFYPKGDLKDTTGEKDKEVTWMPAYGPEQRGGTANVTVIVSDERISSPILSKYDIAVVLNQPSLEKFEPKIKPGGILIYDGFGIIKKPTRKDITVYEINAMDKAAEMKNGKVFNMIVLGGLLKIAPVVSTNGVEKALKKTLPERHHGLIPLNMQAIEEGGKIITLVG